MKRIAVLVFMLVVIMQVFATKMYNLVGSIGNYPIYLQFADSDTDNDIMGIYFYKRSLKDIHFEGSRDGNEYLLQVQSEYQKISETFRLKKDNRNQFTGTWEGVNGKKMAVKLTPIDINSINNRYDNIESIAKLKQSDSYEYARASLIELKRDSVSVINGKGIVWFSEKHVNCPFFRLGNGFSKDQLSVINKELDEIHINNILNQMTCTSMWSYNNGDNIEYYTTIGLLTNDLIAFDISASWYCGGAHPDFGGIGYLIDLNTGKSFDFKNIYDITIPQLYQVLDSEYYFTKPESDDDCDYLDISVWEYFRWSITDQGVFITPSFPRVNRNCEDAFLIPFSKLDKYKRASFNYNFTN